MNDFESMERDEPIDIETAGQASEPAPTVTLEEKLQELELGGGLPYELPPGPEPVGEEGDVLRQLYNFFLFGKRPQDAGPSVTETAAIPALLYQYRDLSRIRHDFPFCLRGTEPAGAVCTLTQLIDELIAGVSDEGDAGERLKQHIYRIEPEIRALAGDGHTAGLLGLWDRAAKSLLSRTKLGSDKKEQLREDLARTRQTLTDVEMIACDADAPHRLLAGLAVRQWRERCAPVRAELDSLAQQLADMLSIDFNNSPEGRDAERLRESTATDDAIDFSTLSSILSSSHLDRALPKKRSKRIKTALEAILKVKPLFDYYPDKAQAADDLPFAIDAQFTNCAAALEEHESRMLLFTEFFKAMAVARLELDNRYKEDAHDAYFKEFSVSNLNEEELALCPPVLLCFKCSDLVVEDVHLLLGVLTSDMPVKVLMQLDDLYVRNGPSRQSVVAVNWPARLANLAMSATRSYVLQSPLSRLPVLAQGFLDGLAYHGPALFSVYVGNDENRASLPRYFDAGSAMESRVFPVFTFNPDNGATLRERLDIQNNNQLEQDWPTDQFHFRAADNSEKTLDLKFTPAGFLLNDKRFTDQYWGVPQNYQHENMLPLQEYLARDSSEVEDRIPYIRTVDADGCIQRVTMTRHVVGMVRECAAFWRNLQELGGVNNSYTLYQVEQEKARLEQEKEQEVEAVTEKYQVQLEQHIGTLTEEIVGRIAGQLLQTGTMPVSPMTQPLPAAAPAPEETPAAAEPPETAEAPPPAPAEEEEEEEASALDDPYIDTPLCTSCEDCIKVNNQIFAYDGNKQAYIKDAAAGPYKDLVRAAEKCPVKIIHPGKPKNPDEPGLEDLLKRAAPFM